MVQTVIDEQLLAVAARMSDEALLARLKLLATQSREVTVELIAHLVEVARRGIHRAEGPGKLFGYVTQVLGFSEAAAWNRIQAARAVRRFPITLDLLADGSVNLTTVRLLGPHLTKENHRALLAEVTGKGKSAVKKIVARIAPQPDVPASIRKLPTLAVSPVGGTPQPAKSATALGPVHEPLNAPPPAMVSTRPLVAAAASTAPESHRAVVEALSPARYRLQLTMDQKAHDDLRSLQDLMRREIADGDPAAIVSRALALLREQAEKKAFAATSKPRPHSGRRRRTRDTSRRRCGERSYLEYHHVTPYAAAGQATVENIALRCRAHNDYEAELLFGRHDDRIRETEALRSAETCSETRQVAVFTGT